MSVEPKEFLGIGWKFTACIVLVDFCCTTCVNSCVNNPLSETDNELREIKKALARMDKKGTHPFSLSMH